MKYPLTVMATAALATSAFGVDRLVPQQYPTIQAAVDASVNGDRVVVSPGLYRESVRFAGKSIMLAGKSAKLTTSTVISGFGVDGPAVNVSDVSNYSGLVGLQFLTITNEGVYEPGQNSGALFSDLGPHAEVLVDHCVFRDNFGGSAYGALYIGHRVSRVSNCVFHSNRVAPGGVGAAIYYWNTTQAPGVSLIENSLIRDHEQPGLGVLATALGLEVTFRNSLVRSVPTLLQNYGTASDVRFEGVTACGIGGVVLPGFAGYIDGGGNNWNGPCPDCDGDGVIDLEEMLFNNGDCNANGLLDACEIPSNPSWDRNNDGILDACQCLADISGNGSVDGVDLAAVLGAWGSPAGGKSGADIDGDGVVNGSDLAYVLSGWGPCPN